MTTVSIVIPRYKETQTEIFPLLTSIYDQMGVDLSALEVVIVNDGGGAGPLPDAFLTLFGPIQIRQVNLPDNVGPGMARQAGLDEATGTYVMFCDADDVLYSVGVIEQMLHEIENSDPDILVTRWFEEVQGPNGMHVYVAHEQDFTWMHGKMFRRQFLVDNNIRHSPELRIHEDSYFIGVATSYTDKVIYLNEPTYVWKYHENSITRCNNAAYSYESLPTFIYAVTMGYRISEQNKPNNMAYSVVQLVSYIYFIIHQSDWLSDEHRGHMAAVEVALVTCIEPYWHYYIEAEPALRIEVYNQERARSFGNNIEIETIDMWLHRLGLLKNYETEMAS